MCVCVCVCVCVYGVMGVGVEREREREREGGMEGQHGTSSLRKYGDSDSSDPSERLFLLPSMPSGEHRAVLKCVRGLVNVEPLQHSAGHGGVGGRWKL